MSSTSAADFYAAIPVFRGFARLMEPSLYRPLPDDWTVGVADIVDSTKAIADKRYKAVNMAGAAVIAAVTNGLGGREFPFVFGGDGASFAVAPGDVDRARATLAATATWVREDLGLTMRVALVPMAAIRAQGLDVRVARYGPSANLRRRARLGGGGDETRRIRRAAGAPRHAAGSLRPVLPVRGNSVRARAHPLGAGTAGGKH